MSIYILDANKKYLLESQLPIPAWVKEISLDILVTTTTHIIHIIVYINMSHRRYIYIYKNTFFSGKPALHFALCLLTGTYTDANKSCM
jgi:hypothetical protein